MKIVKTISCHGLRSTGLKPGVNPSGDIQIGQAGQD